MDRQLAALARHERCYFTRYADDLTFSTDRTVFPVDLALDSPRGAVVGQKLTKIMSDAGFTINAQKTRLIRRSQRQRVTGMVVNRQLNVPRAYVRSLRYLLYVWKRHGLPAAEQAFAKTTPHPNWPPPKAPPPFVDVVRGRVQYVGSVKGWDDPVYTALKRSLIEVDPGFARPDPRSPGTQRTTPDVEYRLHVCTEGETDVIHVIHLTAALEHFHSKGQFRDLILVLDESSAKRSDTELKKHLVELPAQKPPIATACLFDRDHEELLSTVGLREVDYVDRGNGVVAAALVAPDFRDIPFCIEMLYPDEDLAIRNSDRRRVYLRSEFNPKTGHHRSERCSMSEPWKKGLVREEVYEFETQYPLALSKSHFGLAIQRGDPPYDGITFDGFRPTFEMLRTAVRQVAHKVGSP